MDPDKVLDSNTVNDVIMAVVVIADCPDQQKSGCGMPLKCQHYQSRHLRPWESAQYLMVT